MANEIGRKLLERKSWTVSIAFEVWMQEYDSAGPKMWTTGLKKTLENKPNRQLHFEPN